MNHNSEALSADVPAGVCACECMFGVSVGSVGVLCLPIYIYIYCNLNISLRERKDDEGEEKTVAGDVIASSLLSCPARRSVSPYW